MRLSEIIDGADVIHAPASPNGTVGVDDFRQRTACGLALRACSDDITTPDDATFERLMSDDERCCWECKSILA